LLPLLRHLNHQEADTRTCIGACGETLMRAAAMHVPQPEQADGSGRGIWSAGRQEGTYPCGS
jgi:hypothetical protein